MEGSQCYGGVQTTQFLRFDPLQHGTVLLPTGVIIPDALLLFLGVFHIMILPSLGDSGDTALT